MKNNAAVTKETSVVKENINVEISKVSAAAIGIASILIGCWAVATLISGMISTGGPMALVKGFITAISG